MIEFEIAGEPKTKGRPRFSKHGHAYTPKATREAEAFIAEAWLNSGGRVLEGFLSMECIFFVGTKRVKDLDNMCKLVQDALNGKAFADDSQIVRLTCLKVFTTSDKARSYVKLQVVNSVLG
jgi:Holliday junction resolvase RusA-like endonuclease